MSADERTGWRDQGLSELHRTWGKDLYACNIDDVWVEFYNFEPAGLAEYKHERAEKCYPDSATYRVIKRLGNRAALPTFGVRYADDYSWFKVTPINGKGREVLPVKFIQYTQEEYRRFLYRLRGLRIPEDSDEGAVEF